MAQRDQEIPLFDSRESDFEPEAMLASPESRRSRAAVLAIGITACAAFLASAHAFGSSRLAEASVENLVGESHFTQNCAFKCNRDFMGKHANATGDYMKCCSKCPGSTCTFPCTEACRQDRDKALSKANCGNTDALCKTPMLDAHAECCSRCPGSICVAKSVEKITQPTLPSGPQPVVASAAPDREADQTVQTEAVVPATVDGSDLSAAEPVVAAEPLVPAAPVAPAAPATAATSSQGTGAAQMATSGSRASATRRAPSSRTTSTPSAWPA